MTFKTFPRSLLLALAIGMPAAAPAQTVAVHQAAPAAATTPTPAKATASAIIPGSPLAALTGASPTATPDDAPDLFSTDNVGLSVMTRIADEASVTISEFGRAIKHSTELTPVWQWLRDVLRDPAHRLEVMQAFGALALTILPGLGAEAILLFLLTRPRAALVRYAIHWRERDLARRPDPIEAAESGETEKRPGPKLSFLGWLRRFGLASVYILLALLPLFGFALTVGILIGAGLVGVVTARLIVIGVANAYLVCRLSAGSAADPHHRPPCHLDGAVHLHPRHHHRCRLYFHLRLRNPGAAQGRRAGAGPTRRPRRAYRTGGADLAKPPDRRRLDPRQAG
jgi:small conductance mechanosensitive channel